MSTLGTLGLLAGYLLLAGAWVTGLPVLVRIGAERRFFLSRVFFFAGSAIVLWCFALLAVGSVMGNSAVRYVAMHVDDATPWYERLSAAWIGLEGRLLLWVTLVLCFGSLAWLSLAPGVGRRFRQQFLLGLATVATVGLGVVLLAGNPFSPAVLPVAEGPSAAVLFRHWSAALHGVALAGGCAALAVVFFAAMGDENEPSRSALISSWSRRAWVLLTGAIGLYAWWTYHQLHSDACWRSTPIEDATLGLWLIATGLVHLSSRRPHASGKTAALLAGLGLAVSLVVLALWLDLQGFVSLSVVPLWAMLGAAAVILATVVQVWRLGSVWETGDGSRTAGLVVLGVLAIFFFLDAFRDLVLAWWGLQSMRLEEFLRAVLAWTGLVLLVVLFWCGLVDLPRRSRLRQEGGLSAVALAGVACFLLWMLTDLAAVPLLAAFFLTAVGVSVAFELFFVRRFRFTYVGKLAAHLGLLLVLVAVMVGGPLAATTSATLVGTERTAKVGPWEAQIVDLAAQATAGGVRHTAAVRLRWRGAEVILRPIRTEYEGGLVDHRPDVAAGARWDLYAVLDYAGGGNATVRIYRKPFMACLWAGLALLFVGGLMGLGRTAGDRAGEERDFEGT